MYTTHTLETEDVFVCGVCDAVLVSKQGMEEHLTSQHGEELLIMDIETIRHETEALRRDPDQEGEEDQESGEEEESGAPNIDMSLVDHQFYVCRLCDDVFIDRNHLEVHLNINHDLNESPKPRRLLRKMVDSDRNARKVYRVGLSQAQTPGKASTTITPPQMGHALFNPPSDHSDDVSTNNEV